MDYEMPFWSLLFRKSPSFGRNSFTEAARSRLVLSTRSDWQTTPKKPLQKICLTMVKSTLFSKLVRGDHVPCIL